MSGQTHAAIGANAVWIIVLAGMVDERAWIFVVAGAIAGLLPDIDARGAKIHSIGGEALGAFRGIFEHRGFFHSLLALVLVYLASHFFLSEYHPLLPPIITTGYASHLFIDGLNFKGVRYLFPMHRMFHLVPKWLATPVRGFLDQLLLVAGLAGVALFFLFQFYGHLSII